MSAVFKSLILIYLLCFQSKQGQAIGMATNTGQGQIQLNSSQGTIRFSQPQIVASNGNAQLISSQPVFTNQMIQAMASQLQQFPQQQIMLTQGQTPALSTGRTSQKCGFSPNSIH